MNSRSLLGHDGPLARGLATYEVREGQLQMADAVERTLRDDGILLCEAGTGTGKTLAYLVPALLSGRRVIVSTATRALQEQIATRDLPLIRQTLGLSTPVAVMKGLGNYLCLRRFEETRARAETLSVEKQRGVSTIEKWRRETESGDIAELAQLPEEAGIWRDVTSSSDTRVGPPCEFFADCYVTKMKRAAEAARIVVVNHHLFFADLALRGPHPGRVLPDYDAVIFDEAHQLEDIATDFFGLRVSNTRIETLCRDVERALALSGQRAEAIGRLSSAVRTAADNLWDALAEHTRAGEARVPVTEDVFSGAAGRAWLALDSRLEELAAGLTQTRGAGVARGASRSRGADALEVGMRRVDDLRTALTTIAEGTPGRVTWLELGKKQKLLSSSPVDLSGILQERVFGGVPAVVLTSATLATGGHGGTKPDPAASEGEVEASAFAYLRSRLGLARDRDGPEELVVPSPFDFERHALLYTPRDLPSPRDAEFEGVAADRIAALVRITSGGAFVLTTSLRSMNGLAAALRKRLREHVLLVQGQAPKTALLETFREAGDAVLVATSSFWEGVDVPGRALRLVVLEKVPFAVPTDPVLAARARAIEEDGGNPFMDLVVPAAALSLKQGFGRLIRSHRDTGIVALLDERVHRRGYGKRLLRALPPARRVESLEEVRQFWAELEGAL